MDISISNIAWDTTLDTDVQSILARHKVQHIDIAPPKYFPHPASATQRDISAVRQRWEKQGIAIKGMQSLLFGTQGLNVFADQHTQQKMLKHLETVCNIGQHLGAKYLVFGSPRNRDTSGLAEAEIESIYLNFFRRLGDIATRSNTIICLEPNPKEYNSNFMTNAKETAAVVRHINHDGIAMQFDSGAVFMNEEDPAQIIKDHADIIGHIHISEPKLLPVGSLNSPHKEVAANIKEHLPNKTCTIEMLTSNADFSLSEIEKSIAFASEIYGKNS